MDIISGVTQFKIPEKTVVTLGKFDGIHVGHMALVKRALEVAAANGFKTAVFTFDIMPGKVLDDDFGMQLTDNNEKRHLFSEAGIDYLVEFPFDSQTKAMAPLDFIGQVVTGCMNAAYIIVGNDFRFGYGREGSSDTILAARKLFSYEAEVMDKILYNGREISSTWIRQEVLMGNMENVNILLGYPYMIAGKVSRGRQVGKELGFPTLNIYPSREKLLPPNGVYASRVFADGHSYYGVTNIGLRPTFEENDSRISVETHIIDAEPDLYGKDIRVELMHFERPEVKFDSVEKLKSQVLSDIDFAKKFFMT